MSTVSLADFEVPAPVEGLPAVEAELSSEVNRVASRIAQMLCESGYELRVISVMLPNGKYTFRARTASNRRRVGERRVLWIFSESIWEDVTSYYLETLDSSGRSHHQLYWTNKDHILFIRALEAGMVDTARTAIQTEIEEKRCYAERIKGVW